MSLSAKSAAIEVLRAEGRPLHYREITRLALERGLYTTQGATPWETINAQLSVALVRDPANAPVIRVNPGVWMLRGSGSLPAPAIRRTRPKPTIVIDPNEAGHLVMFRSRDAFIRPAELEAELNTVGIDWVSVPSSLPPVARAVRSISHYRTARSTGQPVRVEVLSQTQEGAVFGILFRVEVEAGQEVSWLQRDVVTFTESGGWSTPATAEGLGFVVHASKWQTHLDYNWIRDRVFVTGFERCAGFSVGGGGLYYLHGQMETIERMRALARKIGHSDLNCIAIGTDEETRRAVGEAAIDAISAQVVEITDRLGKWKEKASGRTSTLDRMMGDLDDIRDRASQLAAVLRFSTSEIEDAMNVVVDEIRSAMLGASTAIADAPVEPESEPVAELPSPEPVAELPAPEPTIVESVVVPGEDPFGTDQADAEAEDMFPTPEQLETGSKADLVRWATRLGVPLKGADRKAKTALVLASEIAALREQRRTG